MSLQLEPFTQALAMEPYYLGWLNNKTLMQYSENRHREHDVDSAIDYFTRMDDANNPFWAVMEDGEHVGNVTAYLDRHNRVADLSILIGEPNKGLGTRAWNLAIRRVFAETETRKIEAGTMSLNVGMLRVFHKTGMNIEGRKTRHFQFGGDYADLVQACVFR